MFDGWPAQSCHGFALLCDAANGGALRCAALRCAALLWLICSPLQSADALSVGRVFNYLERTRAINAPVMNPRRTRRHNLQQTIHVCAHVHMRATKLT